MQTRLRARTQTEREDTEHFLSGSRQIPSVSDRQPPLSARRSSPTTPCQEPRIRTLAKELENAEFRTPDGPGGNDPDPDDPDDDDGGDDNAPDPDAEDNPLLMLTNAITHLSNATRHRPEDSGAAHTKVHEPDTFDGMDPKKLHEFLVQCELNFCDRPQAFRLDSWKVGFALAFLKGIALAWFKPDLLNAIPDHIKDEIAHGIDARYWECKSEIARQAKTNPQPSSSKQSSSGGSSSKQSNPSSGTSSSSSAGKGKNP
ncbi:hypothetical protein ID866_12361, partial [Astraeus odoratus]